MDKNHACGTSTKFHRPFIVGVQTTNLAELGNLRSQSAPTFPCFTFEQSSLGVNRVGKFQRERHFFHKKRPKKQKKREKQIREVCGREDHHEWRAQKRMEQLRSKFTDFVHQPPTCTLQPATCTYLIGSTDGPIFTATFQIVFCTHLYPFDVRGGFAAHFVVKTGWMSV